MKPSVKRTTLIWLLGGALTIVGLAVILSVIPTGEPTVHYYAPQPPEPFGFSPRLIEVSKVIAGMLMLVLLCVLYFVPTIVAVVRQKQNSVAIGVLNLLLGWSLIGWIAALVWALTVDQRTLRPVST